MSAHRLQVVGITAATVLLAVLLVAAGYLGRVVTEPHVPATTASTGDLDPKLITEIISILQQDFVDPTVAQPQNLFAGAIEGVFQQLHDSHSTYVTPKDYALTRDDFSGGFQGIGATVSQQDNYVVILQTLPNTPAQKAGLQSGDALLTVNGESAEGWTVEQAVLKIRGPRGSAVEIKVRHRDGTEQTYTITREDVLVASVVTTPPAGTLRDSAGAEAPDIAYMHILSFTSRTPQELKTAVGEATQRGAKGILIDLRSNPGGLLAETTQIADFFLDSGVIVSQVDRNGGKQQATATAGHITDLPIVILQDQDSASGSEVLAAALRDNGRAAIVGTRSFGKGTVNHYRDLSNGGAVYVSIARWLTPKGQQIEGQGVQPDVVVNFTDDDVANKRDVQVARGIDLLRSANGMTIPVPSPTATPALTATATATPAR
jgi:carboxyl-terminal processing protease